MFWPLILPSAPVVVWLVSEQVSKYGSTSPFIAPPVAPEITFSAPRVDGPKVVSQSLSLME